MTLPACSVFRAYGKPSCLQHHGQNKQKKQQFPESLPDVRQCRTQTFVTIKDTFVPEADRLPNRKPRLPKMCKLQHFYYNQCVHRVCRITSVCRNRDLPGRKCRESTNLYFPGRCGPCIREHGENETLDAQQPNDWSVQSSNPAETSDFDPAEFYSRVCIDTCPRLDLPALPDSPTSIEDEHSPANTAQHEYLLEALQRLKLTDRFNTPLASVLIPTFNAISYATFPEPQCNKPHSLQPRNSVQSLIDYYNGLDSGYESSDSSSTSPLTSPTAPSSNNRLTILSDLFDFDNTGVRSHIVGRKHARCKVKCKKPKVKDDEEDSVALEVETCKYGTHRVLDRFGDVPSEELCGWHSTHRGVDEQRRACRVQNEDGEWVL
jgi:hypothetical protein